MARPYLAAAERLQNAKPMMPANRYKELESRFNEKLQRNSQMALGWAQEAEDRANALQSALDERWEAQDALCRDLKRRSGEATSQQELAEIRKAIHQARREAQTLEDQEGEITRLRAEVSKIRKEPIAYVDDLIDKYPRLFPGMNPLEDWHEVVGRDPGLGFDPTVVGSEFTLSTQAPQISSRRRR